MIWFGHFLALAGKLFMDRLTEEASASPIGEDLLLPRAGENVSLDDFLGGQIRLVQPLDGYRVSMDTILLAAAIPARKGDQVLEPGIGTGGAALALARRVPGVKVTGLELQPQMAAFARRNIALNSMQDEVSLIEGDIMTPCDAVPDGAFDHVMANPPYLTPGTGMRPPSKSKGLAHMDSSASLKDWLNFCVAKARHKGTVTVIHRTDMLQQVIARLHRSVGELTLLPLWPRERVAAKRFILQGRKGMHGGMTILPGLALHGVEDRYTRQAEKILRDGEGIKVLTLGSFSLGTKASGG